MKVETKEVGKVYVVTFDDNIFRVTENSLHATLAIEASSFNIEKVEAISVYQFESIISGGYAFYLAYLNLFKAAFPELNLPVNIIDGIVTSQDVIHTAMQYSDSKFSFETWTRLGKEDTILINLWWRDECFNVRFIFELKNKVEMNLIEVYFGEEPSSKYEEVADKLEKLFYTFPVKDESKPYQGVDASYRSDNIVDPCF